jgi:hypothetical protein
MKGVPASYGQRVNYVPRMPNAGEGRKKSLPGVIAFESQAFLF